ncbi:MAG: hypothetical protein IJ740_04595, partial [Ruminococcus sp.]|nr:hypothetical protein [Ruminococcus sp.]
EILLSRPDLKERQRFSKRQPERKRGLYTLSAFGGKREVLRCKTFCGKALTPFPDLGEGGVGVRAAAERAAGERSRFAAEGGELSKAPKPQIYI